MYSSGNKGWVRCLGGSGATRRDLQQGRYSGAGKAPRMCCPPGQSWWHRSHTIQLRGATEGRLWCSGLTRAAIPSQEEAVRWPSLALPSSLLPERLTSQTMELGGWKLRQPDSSQDGEGWKGKYHIINMEFYNKLNLLNVGCVVISISERNLFSSKIQDVKRKAKQQAVLRGGEHSILQSCFWSEKGSTSKQLQEVPETDRIYSATPFPCVYK